MDVFFVWAQIIIFIGGDGNDGKGCGVEENTCVSVVIELVHGLGVTVSAIFLFVFELKSLDLINISSFDLTPKNCRSLQKVTLSFTINSSSLILLSYSSYRSPLVSRLILLSCPVNISRTAS